MRKPLDAPVRTASGCPPLPEGHLLPATEGKVTCDNAEFMPPREAKWAWRMELWRQRGQLAPLPCAPLDQLYPDVRGVNALQGWCVDG